MPSFGETFNFWVTKNRYNESQLEGTEKAEWQILKK